MTRRTRLAAAVWIAIAVLLRLYGAQGGDASIVGGLIYLVWTAPFGFIWQFWIASLPGFPNGAVADALGDIASIGAGAAFWFWGVPKIRGRRGRSLGG